MTQAENALHVSTSFVDRVINAYTLSASVEKDWDAGNTTFIFSDGSKIVWDDIGFHVG